MSIVSFRNEFAFLSNFHILQAPIIALLDPADQSSRVRVYTSEHFFMMAKTQDPAERRKIAQAPTPGKAKRLGREVTLRADWEPVKLDVMLYALRKKFGNNPDIAKRLLKTGDRALVEGNVWHDNFWGNCFCPKCMRKKGLNHLGRLLMKVREELKDPTQYGA